jgi:hypothetical protein
MLDFASVNTASGASFMHISLRQCTTVDPAALFIHTSLRQCTSVDHGALSTHISLRRAPKIP